MAAQILVVDDEKEIADLVEVYLGSEGYQMTKCYDPLEALRLVEERVFDLAILDVMMPQMDGFTLCRKIREHHAFPVIMLTAKVDDQDKIVGLGLGADDYVTKPFNPLELVARVKAQLRRYLEFQGDVSKSENILDFSGLVIDREKHTCSLYDEELTLTPTEFSILWYLCENRGRVVPSEELFETVWGEKYLDSNNTVMVHIRRLREKMHETPRAPKFIKTVWGVGYKIEG